MSGTLQRYRNDQIDGGYLVVAISPGEYHRKRSASLVYQEVYLCTLLAPISGVLARFFSSQRSRRVLGIHRLPLPRDPTALFGIVLDHPIHQLFEDAHLPPPLETLVNDACGDPKPLPMDGLPLAATPQHVPDSVGDGSVGHPRPAAPLLTLVPLFGQVLLEFPPQRSWKAEVVHFALCGSLSHKAHLLWDR